MPPSTKHNTGHYRDRTIKGKVFWFNPCPRLRLRKMLYNCKLRSLAFYGFLIFAIVPLISLGMFMNNRVLQDSIEDNFREVQQTILKAEGPQETLQDLIRQLDTNTNDGNCSCSREAVRAAAIPFVKAVENNLWSRQTQAAADGLRQALVVQMLKSLLDVVSENTRDKPKVLVHSMARSGSSLLAELMSLSPKAAYVFEPIKSIRFTDSALHLWGTHEIEKIAPMMQGIFTCHPVWLKSLKNLAKLSIERCWNADPLVVKTIRLRLNKIEEWSSRNKLDWLKVIHLVRDPRARYHSLLNNKKDFINAAFVFNQSCTWEMEDIKMKYMLPTENYVAIRYEDLVSNLMEEIRKLYAFVGVPFGNREMMLVKMHTEEPESAKANAGMKDEYYSTYRSKDFNPNAWRDNLSLEQIRMVEEKCKDVLDEYGYEIFSPMKK